MAPSRIPSLRALVKKAFHREDESQPPDKTEHEIFQHIKAGNLPTVIALLSDDPELLDERNNDGAAPIHAAYLHMKYDIARAIIRRFPHCATFVYASGPERAYFGENVLHIVIVQRALEEAEWLMRQFPQLLDDETMGEFFLPANVAYFGGFPLLFAVSTDQSDAVELILRTPKGRSRNAGLTCCDRYGNNALHMAVVHDLPDMYDFIMRTQAHLDYPMLTDLADKENHDGLTPLALAAAMGRVHLFQKILSHIVKPEWVYGPTHGHLLPLRRLDQPVVFGAHSKPQLSSNPVVLRCLSASDRTPMTNCLELHNGIVPREIHTGRLLITNLPDIRELIDQKWKHFGYPIYFRKFAMFMLVMVVWTAATMIPLSYTNDPTFISQFPVNSGWIIALESCVLLFVVFTILMELWDILLSGVRYFKAYHGIVAVIHALRMLFCLLVVIDVGLRAGLQYNPQLVFTALASITGWTCALAMAVGFRMTGPYIIAVKQMIFRDVRKFAIVWFTVLMGFSTAVHCVRARTDETIPVQYFKTFRDMIIQGVLGEFLFTDIDADNTNSWLMSLLIVVYICLDIIILRSILIAMLGSTYRAVAKEAECRWHVERINLMSFFETELSITDMYFRRTKYGITLNHDEHPDFDTDLFLPVTTVNTDWRQGVDLEQQFIVEQHKRLLLEEEEAKEWDNIVECLMVDEFDVRAHLGVFTHLRTDGQPLCSLEQRSILSSALKGH